MTNLPTTEEIAELIEFCRVEKDLRDGGCDDGRYVKEARSALAIAERLPALVAEIERVKARIGELEARETDAIETAYNAGFGDGKIRAARLCRTFLVGDPANGVPLRNPMPHEVEAHIRKFLTPDDMKSAEARAEKFEADLARLTKERDEIGLMLAKECSEHMGAIREVVAERDRMKEERDAIEEECAEAIKAQNGVVLSSIDKCIAAKKTLPCGHHHSLAVESVESDIVLCELCEMRSERNDAVLMEAEYRTKFEEAEADIARLTKERDDARAIIDGQNKWAAEQIAGLVKERDDAHMQASDANSAIRNIGMSLGSSDEWTDQWTMIADVEGRVARLSRENAAMREAVTSLLPAARAWELAETRTYCYGDGRTEPIEWGINIQYQQTRDAMPAEQFATAVERFHAEADEEEADLPSRRARATLAQLDAPPAEEAGTIAAVNAILDAPPSGPGYDRLMSAARPWGPAEATIDINPVTTPEQAIGLRMREIARMFEEIGDNSHRTRRSQTENGIIASLLDARETAAIAEITNLDAALTAARQTIAEAVEIMRPAVESLNEYEAWREQCDNGVPVTIITLPIDKARAARAFVEAQGGDQCR